MPTSATHITVIEQLALRDGAFRSLLGDPTADPDTPEGTKMCFAKLGSVGPDVLYLLGDFNRVPATALQDLENFLVKIGGTLAYIGDLSERVNKWLDGVLDEITAGVASELQRTSALINGVKDQFISALVVNGVNVWSLFRPPRQEDLPRERWFWADYLHYVHTGAFVEKLLANSIKDEELHAYAAGYLTHYVTDVVGHPYVNQVVQGPYRMHWQRHHLVENFIDAYVWDRWHVQQPDPGGSEERPLDLPTNAPNMRGRGAPLLTSRLHDHITIGDYSLGDPVDRVIRGVAAKIEAGLFDIGVLDDISLDDPAGDGLKKWANLLIKTLHDVYDVPVSLQNPHPHPTILAEPPDPRPRGFPSEDDVKGAYGVLRLLLKIGTEEEISAPVFPDIASDISDIIERTMQQVMNDIGGIPPAPTPSSGGSFSLDSLMEALSDIVQWAGEVLDGVASALVDLVQGAAQAGVVVVSDAIKAVLWLLNSALFALYRYFRDILVVNAYSPPFTDELTNQILAVDPQSLWVSQGNLQKGYPAEEKTNARDLILSTYHPYVAPFDPKHVELPSIAFAAPYGAGSRPEAFLENTGRGNFLQRPAGTDNMFDDNGPQAEVTAEQTFTQTSKNFGPAIPNCAFAFRTLLGNQRLVFPNYDMDGDRGYAWPGWTVSPEPPDAGFDVLDPTKPGNQAGVSIKVKKIT